MPPSRHRLTRAREFRHGVAGGWPPAAYSDWPPPEIRVRQIITPKSQKLSNVQMDRSAVFVQVIAMLGTILALVGVGAFGKALITLLLLQNLLTIAIAYDRYNKSQSKHYFLRKDLLFPLDSPYWKVLNSEGSECGYRVLLRTNKAAFDLICANVDPDFMRGVTATRMVTGESEGGPSC